MINYFNVEKFKDKYLITNDFKEYMFLTKTELGQVIKDEIDYKSELGMKLLEKRFVFECSKSEFAEDEINNMRLIKGHLLKGTGLHIFVLTNICNLQCIYCQARIGDKTKGGKMTFEIAEKAVDLALQSPDDYLTFEFQGGEPLANFDTLKHIVEYTEQKKGTKTVGFNLVSNLTLMTDEIIDFIIEHEISLCCSLDGNKHVHDHNRKFFNGIGSYDNVIEKIHLLRSKGLKVGAIETTTNETLKYPKEIIDEYVQQGFESIFIRPLTPLGNAYDSWNDIGYTPEEFVEFYKKVLRYLLEVNKKGIFISDGFSSIILKGIIAKNVSNYMELRSPCGATLGQMAYYFDGNIYTCDEGRMLAEMGDSTFKIGNVFDDTYNSIFDCNACKVTCVASVLESTPQCCDCVYHPYCGLCPVVNYALDNDIFPKGANNYKCRINKGMLDSVFEILYNNNSEDLDIFKSWVN